MVLEGHAFNLGFWLVFLSFPYGVPWGGLIGIPLLRAPVILQELLNELYGLLFQKIRSPISRGDWIVRNKWPAPMCLLMGRSFRFTQRTFFVK